MVCLIMTNVNRREIAVIIYWTRSSGDLGDSLKEIAAESSVFSAKAGKKAVIAKLAPEVKLVCQTYAELAVELYQVATSNVLGFFIS